MKMIKRPLGDSSMRKVILLCGVVALLVCLVPLSSAGINANIVIENVTPTALLPGETKELTLTIKNAGSYDAVRITLNFQKSQYISVVGPSSVSIASLNGWSSRDVTITVHVAKGAPGGTYVIPVNCTFDQKYREGGEEVTTTMLDVSYSIALRVAHGSIIVISDISPSELSPGEKTDLKFTITNIGNFPLDNIVFSWNDAQGVILPVNADNTKYIARIAAGESTVVTYTVVADVNADAGLYQLDLTMKLSDDESGGSSLINTTAGIVIGGGTDFDVLVSESSSGQTSLSVANTGNNPAYSVTVRIPAQRQFRVQDSTASIVGNLDKGDYTIVSFQITSTNASFGGPGTVNLSQQEQPSEEEWQRRGAELSQRNATKSTNLRVAIDYTDTTGVRRTVEKAVPIQSVGMSSVGSQFTPGMRQRESIWKNPTLLGTTALVILLSGGVMYYRRRKKGNAFLTGFSRVKKE